MKRRFYFLTVAIMALTLTACNKGEAIPVCPPLPEGSTTEAHQQVAEWDYFPQMHIHYEDADFTSSARLTLSETYTWGATMADGSRGLATSDSGARPYQMEGLCTVTMADTGGEVRLAFFPETMNAIEGAEFYAAEALTDLTLTAYPVAKDGTVDVTPEQSQTIPVTNGRFTLPVGQYYYELTMPQNDGQLVYGFIAHRIDAEEYEVTEHIDGCFVTYEYEDPDHQIKQLPTVTVSTEFGREGGRHGMVLRPLGTVTHTYINAAGTKITRRADFGDPMAEEDMHLVTTSDLFIEYEIEWPFNQKVTAAQYERYAHDGTLLDGKALVSADIPSVNTILLEPNSYYVFTVYYEDITSQYVLKTGEGMDAVVSHPKDDPNCDPALAKLLRAEHIHWNHSSRESLETVDVHVYRYLGQFGGMEAVIFEEAGGCEADTYALQNGNTLTLDGKPLRLYFNHQFYTLERAHEKGWLTDEDIIKIDELLAAEAGTRK